MTIFGIKKKYFLSIAIVKFSFIVTESNDIIINSIHYILYFKKAKSKIIVNVYWLVQLCTSRKINKNDRNSHDVRTT